VKRFTAAFGLALTVLVIGWLMVEPLLVEQSVTESSADLASWVGVVALIAGLGVLGGLVAWHRPDEPMGWLFLAFALTFGVRSALESYAFAAFEPPATMAVRWSVFGSNVLVAASTALLVTIAVVFPSGRPASSRWRRALILVWASAVAMALTAPFASMEDATIPSETLAIPSLVAVDGADDLAFFLFLPIATVLLAAVVRIVHLGFRGSTTERLQVRWLAYTLVVTALLLMIAAIYPPSAAIASLVAAFGITASIAIAITRYRLYEINRVINRTISYAMVLGTLAAVFVVVASIPTLVLDRDETPAWVIAASTLVVFSLFSPLRRRIQGQVDRRFHRIPYDPEGILARLAHDLRGELETDSIAAALSAATSEALRPSTAHVWVRR
jgi:hypothetical protein